MWGGLKITSRGYTTSLIEINQKYIILFMQLIKQHLMKQNDVAIQNAAMRRGNTDAQLEQTDRQEAQTDHHKSFC